MIDFEQKSGSSIPPEPTETKLPTEKEVLEFFDAYFKKDVDNFLIYKKNKFKSLNTEIVKDFFSKFESFVRSECKEDKGEIIKLIFSNFTNSLRLLETQEILPNDKKMICFFMSFVLSKFFS